MSKYTSIALDCDNKTLNPLLDKDIKAKLAAYGITDSGDREEIPMSEVKLAVKTLLTTSDFTVIEVSDNGTVTPVEGGLARIDAEYCGLKASVKIVVRPFWREYHKMLTIKLFLGMEPYGSLREPVSYERDENVDIDLDEALDIIRRLDNITGGIPKLVYLVGWQRGGHDHGYPDFITANPKLKRKGDENEVQSLRWLMQEAKKYNTSVSFHINFVDAWEDSPLWDEYAKDHIFAENADGSIQCAGGGFDVIEEKYHIRVANVVQTRLWESGKFQREIKKLIETYPELVDSHSIHIDNWRTIPCEAFGITRDDEENTLIKMFKYLREMGFDATSEGSFHGRSQPMTGLQPMTWIDIPYHQTVIPPSLYCGGRMMRVDSDPRFGDSIHIENTIRVNLADGFDPLYGVLDEFCMYTLPWQFLNSFELLDFDGTTAFYSDGVRATFEEGRPYIWWNDMRVRCGTTFLVPMLWRDERALMLYSYRDTYIPIKLPKDWADVTEVEFYKVDRLGRWEPKLDESRALWEWSNVAVVDGELRLNLNTRTAYIIKPKSNINK